MKYNMPPHYLIAGRIETKPLIDLILNSDEIKEHNLSNAQIFELGNLLKYRLRMGKKPDNTESDLNKALDFEARLQDSLV